MHLQNMIMHATSRITHGECKTHARVAEQDHMRHVTKWLLASVKSHDVFAFDVSKNVSESVEPISTFTDLYIHVQPTHAMSSAASCLAHVQNLRHLLCWPCL